VITKNPRKMALLIAANAVATVAESDQWAKDFTVRAEAAAKVRRELATIERDLWRILQGDETR